MTFKAPNGTTLRGMAQCDEGIWPVYWPDHDPATGERSNDPAAIEYLDDGPSAEWQSVEYDGFAVFVDEKADAWLAHHLIYDDAEPLSKQAIEAARNEMLARSIAASALALADVLPDGIDKGAVLALHGRYQRDARAYRGEFTALRGDQ